MMTQKTVCGQDMPACFTPEEMAEWLRLTQITRKGSNVCEDCCPEGRKRLMASGKCEQVKWQTVVFRFYALRWQVTMLTEKQIKANREKTV